MLINPEGMVIDDQVKLERRPLLERGPMPTVRGIIVHQTGSSTAASSLASYQNSSTGAHFLIDKDGTTYQTASVHQRCNHVGKLRSRCVAEHACAPREAAQINAMSPTTRNRHEAAKDVPARYPDNRDSIGIELVGRAVLVAGQAEAQYESVTAEQNRMLVWLIDGLCEQLKINRTEIFRHPTVSQKTPSEASTARW
ncbi:peptidoglycan recognition protein family protein [Sphingomonas jatrophae]|uniref:N-acetylmuramoyl-L-alanine amidase n=1 Tax=Sphingomonas jatrophae TaxID=1166337 RepID=A0A1I6JEB9_9SPHN|nr:peptidoglycan recognition family protein [Sphingomonas jatrophae]SFR77229.1 N-acetylmuramoyl-L-alanine amidase [Sphingomonas jatrophae]